MSLKLNGGMELYKEFYGNFWEQMPLLLDNRIPMSVAQVMEMRLNARYQDESVMSAWMNHRFDTCDGVVVDWGREMFKIVLDSPVERINSTSAYRGGDALPLSREYFDNCGGIEFKGGLRGLVQPFSRKEAKNNIVLQILARDKGLLNDYVDFVFAEMKEKKGVDIGMGVCLPVNHWHPPNGIGMKLWAISGLDKGCYIYGDFSLGDPNGRWVGIDSEIQRILEM